MSAEKGATYSAGRIASRVAALGKEISREYGVRRLDVIVTIDRGFVFAADLIRQISAPVVCHFVRSDVRDVDHDGHAWREVLFGAHPDLKGRDVGGCSVGKRRYAGFSSAPFGQKQAALHPPGRADGQAREAPRGPGARLLWVPDCI